MPSNAYDGKDEKSNLLPFPSSSATTGDKVEVGTMERVSLLPSKTTVLKMLSAAASLVVMIAATFSKNSRNPLRTTKVPMFKESDPKTCCEVASGKFHDLLTEHSGIYDKHEFSHPFRTCFKARGLDQYCFTESYYDNDDGKYHSCLPQGPNWQFNSRGKNCRLPCNRMYNQCGDPQPCCKVASGKFGGSEDQDNGSVSRRPIDGGSWKKRSVSRPFNTCFQAYDEHDTPLEEYCWTESSYDFKTSTYVACAPKGVWLEVTRGVDDCGPSCKVMDNQCAR